jgi:hypothetical protein
MYKNNSIYNSLKKNQIPRNNLNKGLSDFYKENYKPLQKEIKEDYRRWKISYAHGLAESM